MRKIIYFLFAFFVLMSCGSGNDDTMDSLINSGGNTGELAKGSFVSDAHPTSGTVSVNADKSVLTLKNFKTDAGPKLLLYLSTEVDSNDFVDLGDLKGIEGDFTYAVPANTNLVKYKYVVVWCVDFSVSFGHAELK